MNHSVFSYGTLQKEEVQINLFGRILQGFPDILPGYKISPVTISDEIFLLKGEEKNQLTAVLTNDNTNSIKGTVFEVTEEELFDADTYEPTGYKRIEVMLASGKKAWLYLAVEITDPT